VKIDVTLIYLNYNTSNMCNNCINSFLEHYSFEYSYEIIVIDNCSSEFEQDLLKKNQHITKLITNDTNLGTSKAWNKAAKEANGDYLFYVNCDMLFINDSIAYMLECIKSDSNIAICGGNLFDIDLKPAHSFMEKYDISRIFNETNLLFANKKEDRISEFNYSDFEFKRVDYICGADMLIDKKAFINVGGFDNNIFIYSEEADLSIRLRNLGYLIVNTPLAKMIHFEGDSFKKDSQGFSSFRTEHMIFSKLYLINKHWGYSMSKKFLFKLKKQMIARLVINTIKLNFRKCKVIYKELKVVYKLDINKIKENGI